MALQFRYEAVEPVSQPVDVTLHLFMDCDSGLRRTRVRRVSSVPTRKSSLLSPARKYDEYIVFCLQRVCAGCGQGRKQTGAVTAGFTDPQYAKRSPEFAHRRIDPRINSGLQISTDCICAQR